jgi:hypothetical protein
MRTEGGDLLSPSIWADCPKSQLNDEGQGYFFFEQFLGGVADTVASGEQRPSYGPLHLDCDDDTVVSFLDDLGGRIDIETDGDDNDAWALFTSPFAKIVKNSGHKVWFEARVELGDIAMDGGLFVGLAEYAALSRDAVADDAGDVDEESMFGFQVMTDDPDAIDAIYRLDDGTTAELLSGISTSSNYTAAGGTSSALVADTPVKVGMRFDGRDRLEVFFNGYKVYTYEISSTLFPVGVAMGFVICLKTGADAAESGAVDWAAGAYQTSS